MKKHLPVTLGVAALALVATSGTTAVAASLVTGKQIKNGSVTAADIRDGSLTGIDVADESATGADVRDGTLAGRDITDGSVAAVDLAPGTLPAAPTLVARQVEVTAKVAPDEVKRVNVDCAAGEIATGGGGNTYANPGMNIVQSAPIPAGVGAPTGWQVTYQNTTDVARDMFGYAVCLKLP